MVKIVPLAREELAEPISARTAASCRRRIGPSDVRMLMLGSRNIVMTEALLKSALNRSPSTNVALPASASLPVRFPAACGSPA